MYEKRLTYIEVSCMISMNTKTQTKNQKRAMENDIIFSLKLTRKGRIMNEKVEWNFLDAEETLYTIQKLTANLKRWTEGGKKN